MRAFLAVLVICIAVVVLSAVRLPMWLVGTTFGLGVPLVLWVFYDRHLEDRRNR